MNGMSSVETDPQLLLTPKQKKALETKKDRWRFVLALITTNLFVLILCAFLFEPEATVIEESNLQLLEGYSLMSLPLKTLVPIHEGPQEVSLFNKEGEIVVFKAQLVQQMESGPLEFQAIHLIQIPANQLEKLIPYQHDLLTAHPYREEHSQQSLLAQQTQLRRNYELRF